MAHDNTICCFGELLLRYSPKLNGAFIREASMAVYIGGAELNVASALGNWNQPVKYVTALPANYLSNEIMDYINSRNIDSSCIYLGGDRIGTYFLPQGNDLKNSAVIYDRNHSAFSELQPGMLDWESILEDCNWFHFSAITPALNTALVAVCKEALEVASKKGIMTSVDLNYRSRLWQYGKEPHQVMPELVQYCDVIMGNIWAAEKLLSVHLPESINESPSKEKYHSYACHSAAEIRKAFPRSKSIANTFRFDRDNGIEYFASLHRNGNNFVSPTLMTQQVIDKVGSGDCFMAGLIYGIRNQHTDQHTIDFAAAAAFDKLQQTGDASSSGIDTIQNLIAANG